MPAEFVLDASVAGAFFFEEEASAAAEQLILSETAWIAPDLIFVEMASIAAKKIRRGEITAEMAERVLPELGRLVSRATPASALAARALDLAVTHGFSAYDGLYLALAEAAETRLATADRRLVSRAESCGLGAWVQGV